MQTLQKNTAQEEAIRTINGPVIIISCPGSGKTTTLLRRIEHMIVSGIKGENILMVTFTKAAAEDMKVRYKELFGRDDGVSFMTIHAFCFRVLREAGKRTLKDLIDENEKQNFLFNFLKRFRGIEEPWDMALDVGKEIGVIKNSYIDPAKYKPQSCTKELFVLAYQEYENYKNSLGKIDYEDMMLECEELFNNNKRLLKKYQDRFTHIQCDEYQDTNLIQKNILYLLTGNRRNLCVVGDDDQSIYRFRGARPEIMFNFRKDFPESKIIYMSTNYRSAQNIVDVADILIRDNKNRFDKKFISFRGENNKEEGEFHYFTYKDKQKEMENLVSLIKDAKAHGVEYKEMAVLFRTNKQAQMPMLSLQNAKIPFYSTENIKSIYDEWMFKTIAAYIRLATGNGDKSDLYFVLNRPNRYLSLASFRDVDYNYKDMMKAADSLKRGEYWKYEQAKKNIAAMMSAFGPGTLSMSDSTQRVFAGLVKIGFDKYVREYANMRNLDPQEYFMIYDELMADAAKCGTIEKWLDFARTEVINTKALNLKDNEGVILTTMHKAKGKEWKVVFVIDVNNMTVPHRSNCEDLEGLEEERRLLYVAMTRAKDVLYVMCSGSESPFMTETMYKYRKTMKKKLTVVPKVGDMMIHKKYGIGLVVEMRKEKNRNEERIVLDFAGTERAFVFPDAVQDGLLRQVK